MYTATDVLSQDATIVRDTLNCNYYGTLAAMHSLLPLIRPHGRLVNISSTAGLFHNFSPALADRFRSAKTEEDATQLMREFVDAVTGGREKEVGFPSAAYATSKAGLTAVTRVIARKKEKDGKGVLVNSCCPGLVSVSFLTDGWHKSYMSS